MINIYRFVLGIDVPESPAFVAAGLAPTHVLRSSAPKPLAVSLLDVFASNGDQSPGVAIDFAPYFLAGGGRRSLAGYRSMSVKGRLMRVLTKTILSLGAARDPADSKSLLTGLGLRSTFHDPHDPLGTPLPQDVAAALSRAGVPRLGDGEEDVASLGIDLAPIFARAARAIRRPSANPQVSVGWGVAARVRGGVFNGDSIEAGRHCLWLGAQFTPGRRFDLLTTIQIRNAFRGDRHLWLGAGLERKSRPLDLLAELYYDTQDGTLHPGLAVDAHALAHAGVVASLTTQSASLTASGPRRLELRALLHWFYASGR